MPNRGPIALGRSFTLLHVIMAMICLIIGSIDQAKGNDYPPVPPPDDPEVLGIGVQRTMRRLAESTPTDKSTVRILFYGQSITEQEWSRQVAADLRRRFPNANIDIQNRAIGGFSAQRLIFPAEHDLYPFYPDLLIFHVYGSHVEYERIISEVRSRTTAEVLMQKDHLTRWPPQTIDERADKGAWWDNLMNTKLLPDIARRHGCALIDIRGDWSEYLKSANLEPADLLKDSVHLNDHGNYLMASLVSRYLVYRPELADHPLTQLAEASITTLQVGTDIAWKDGRLTVPFVGNRIDLISASVAATPPRTVQVRIDGRPPSTLPGVYTITRPVPNPWSPLTVVRVDHVKPLVAEEWTLVVTEPLEGSKGWKFFVTGSKTGADGAGTTNSAFHSPSGRVVIEPSAWFRNERLPVTLPLTVRWKVVPQFVDAYRSGKPVSPVGDGVITLAQGLQNGPHELELLCESDVPPPIDAIRVHRPPEQPKERTKGRLTGQ